MASYDNSRYTYAQVLSGTGYYKQDSNLKYSLGVKTMQTKLNNAGFWCGTPYGLTVDGAAGQLLLLSLTQ